MVAVTASGRNARSVREVVQKEHPRIGRAGVGVFPRGATMPSRTLSDHEVVWMIAGRASLTGDEPRELVGGDVLLLPPGVRHAITWHGGHQGVPTRHGYLHFDADAVPRVLPSVTRLVHASPDDPISGLCAYLLWLGTTTEDADPLIARTLDFLLELLLDAPLPGLPVRSELPRPVVAAFSWLGEHWTQHPLRAVTAVDLAAAASVSRPHLTRLCRASLGHSPSTLVALLRCVRAEDLLRLTDLSIADVARQCGYADPVHLAHRFRDLHGVSPREFRRGGAVGSVQDVSGVRTVAHLVWG
jgi:AraC-like DNA-binding protein